MAIAAAAALAGCSRAPSKSSFLSKADGICRTADSPVTSLKGPTSYPELGDAAARLAAAADAQVPKLRGLSRPSGGKAPTDAVFNSLAGVAAAAKSLQAAASHGDDKAAASATNDLTAKAKAADDGARAYGFGTCAGTTRTAAGSVADGAKKIVKASFVLQAEATCKDASRKLDALPDSRTSAAEARNDQAAITILDKVVADVRGLAAPPGDEAAVKEYLDAQQKVIDKAKELEAAARANDERLATAITGQMDTLTTAANAKADALGVEACGSQASF